MSDKHEVTVYDRVPATARVSVGQMEVYLRRTGWVLLWVEDDLSFDVCRWRRSGDSLSTRRDEFMGDEIEAIAQYEQRQPSAVLTDIASEPA